MPVVSVGRQPTLEAEVVDLQIESRGQAAALGSSLSVASVQLFRLASRAVARTFTTTVRRVPDRLEQAV